MALIQVLIAFNIIGSCSGMFLNMVIAVLSFRTSSKDAFWSPRDLLLFSIGLSSAVFGGFQFFTNMTSYIWIEVFMTFNVCINFVNVVFILTIFSSTCLTSLLCSFYCIKLVTFQHWFFTQLRSVFPSLLPWMIAGTFVISAVLLVALVGVISLTAPLLDDGTMSNCPSINETYEEEVQAVMIGLNCMIALPFLLIVVSLGVTFASLVLHVWKLQNSSSLDKSHIVAHIEAAKTMVLLLVLNVLFYLSNLLLNWNLVPRYSTLQTLCIMIYFFFWPLQALILILRTKKLSLTLSSLLLPLKMVDT
ncbi:taste receptor type 2 member 4-like [Engystomops pustulosus]|uniref:taste receptor type 2 member 4-like n=1 Tax=Engystomops pustulosus TaxID=76066 RepID=UPI003AFAEA2F